MKISTRGRYALRMMQEYADKAGADLDTYKEQVGEDVLKDAILRDKVLDYLVDNCVQVEQSDNN